MGSRCRQGRLSVSGSRSVGRIDDGGFVEGRELREGCIIPNIGGGLCQLSNALYDAALKANFEIVERHAHTQIVAGSLAELGRDATVFWNYVDLRFRSPAPFRIETRLDSGELVVRFLGRKGRKRQSGKAAADIWNDTTLAEFTASKRAKNARRRFRPNRPASRN